MKRASSLPLSIQFLNSQLTAVSPSPCMMNTAAVGLPPALGSMTVGRGYEREAIPTPEEDENARCCWKLWRRGCRDGWGEAPVVGARRGEAAGRMEDRRAREVTRRRAILVQCGERIEKENTPQLPSPAPGRPQRGPAYASSALARSQAHAHFALISPAGKRRAPPPPPPPLRAKREPIQDDTSFNPPPSS